MRAIVLSVVVILMSILFIRACAVPVVFKERGSYRMCGCLVDGDYPSPAQCEKLVRGEVYDVVWVSSCY